MDFPLLAQGAPPSPPYNEICKVVFEGLPYRCAFETEAAKSAGRVRPGSQVNMLFKSL